MNQRQGWPDTVCRLITCWHRTTERCLLSCRDEECPDHDRSSATPATRRGRQPGSRSRWRGASMQRTPSAPTVAACAMCGGRTILSPGPSLVSPPAVWNTIGSGRARSTAPFRSRAHASRRYRRGRCPICAGSGPGHASGLRSGLRLAACRHAARPRRQRPSQNLITAASVVCRRGNQAAAVRRRSECP